MNLLDLATLIAYVALNADILFQIHRIYKTKSSHDLSMIGMTVRYIATLIILVKFMVLKDPAVLIGHSLIVLVFSVYLWLAFFYRRASEDSRAA